MEKINLKTLQENLELELNVKHLVETEYLITYISREDFRKKYNLTNDALSYVTKKYSLKKDASFIQSNPENIAKIKNTKLQKYGSANYNNGEKNRKTCLERYGVEHPLQKKEFVEKSKETFNSNYSKDSQNYKELVEHRVAVRNKTLESLDWGGIIRDSRKRRTLENPNFVEDVNNKREQTCLEKYGVKNISQLKEIQEKKEETALNNFGVRFPVQTEEIQEKTRNTILEKYGVDHFSKTTEFASKRMHKWKVDGKVFDSKWEIYYYYYLVDNNIPFETQVMIPYFYEGEEHKYFCDFKRLDTEELIEIKNPAMLDEDNNLKLLFTSQLSEKKLLHDKKLLEQKNQCLEDNNVIILSDADYFKKLEISFKENHNNLIIEKVEKKE